jgi:cytochrome bd-type quinol oxidase subunit 2
MMVHRYWGIALMALVIGFLLGAVVFGVVYLGGSPWARDGQNLEAVMRPVLSFGTVGLVVASAALIGGYVLVASTDRQLAKASGTRTALAALGASGGVLVLGIVFATVQWAIGASGWTYLLVMFTVALAIAAGIVAAFLVHRAERRSERTRPGRVEHPLPSAWVDF